MYIPISVVKSLLEEGIVARVDGEEKKYKVPSRVKTRILTLILSNSPSQVWWEAELSKYVSYTLAYYEGKPDDRRNEFLRQVEACEECEKHFLCFDHHYVAEYLLREKVRVVEHPTYHAVTVLSRYEHPFLRELSEALPHYETDPPIYPPVSFDIIREPSGKYRLLPHPKQYFKEEVERMMLRWMEEDGVLSPILRPINCFSYAPSKEYRLLSDPSYILRLKILKVRRMGEATYKLWLSNRVEVEVSPRVLVIKRRNFVIKWEFFPEYPKVRWVDANGEVRKSRKFRFPAFISDLIVEEVTESGKTYRPLKPAFWDNKLWLIWHALLIKANKRCRKLKASEGTRR